MSSSFCNSEDYIADYPLYGSYNKPSSVAELNPISGSHVLCSFLSSYCYIFAANELRIPKKSPGAFLVCAANRILEKQRLSGALHWFLHNDDESLLSCFLSFFFLNEMHCSASKFAAFDAQIEKKTSAIFITLVLLSVIVHSSLFLRGR